jgi:hypothetical protein
LEANNSDDARTNKGGGSDDSDDDEVDGDKRERRNREVAERLGGEQYLAVKSNLVYVVQPIVAM